MSEHPPALAWRSVRDAGEAALLIDFGDAADPAVNRQVQTMTQAIVEAKLPGLDGPIPGFASVLVQYRPWEISRDRLIEWLARLPTPSDEPTEGRRWEIPVCYDGDCGPDLGEVARRLSLSTDQVVRYHANNPYRIYAMGFSPGFPMAGLLPSVLRLPRRQAPRLAVHPGSVAIAGAQTGIYPFATPGGWHLIGRTPLILFDWDALPPSAYQPGDTLVFRAITHAEHRDWEHREPSDRRPQEISP